MVLAQVECAVADPIQLSYTKEEHAIWSELYAHHTRLLKLNRAAYPPFFEFLEELNLPQDRIPQLHEVSSTLQKKCGWRLMMVDGIISHLNFFSLLAKKIFPSTVFIRKGDMGFSMDPDIFHELFGHATMLLDLKYSAFISKVAKIALTATPLQKAAIQRFLWFTMEVGLICMDNRVHIYGGSLLSSPSESQFSLKNKQLWRNFDIVEIIRSPFRADLFQERYYVINSFDDLLESDLSLEALNRCVNSARQLGEYFPQFEIREEDEYASVDIFKKHCV